MPRTPEADSLELIREFAEFVLEKEGLEVTTLDCFSEGREEGEIAIFFRKAKE